MARFEGGGGLVPLGGLFFQGSHWVMVIESGVYFGVHLSGQFLPRC